MDIKNAENDDKSSGEKIEIQALKLSTNEGA